MPVPTLAELLDPYTADEVMNALLAELQAGAFPTTAWNSGDPERVLIEAEADAQFALWELVPLIAGGGHIDVATGAWLTLLAYNRYNLTRTASVATVGTIRLTCAATAGPYTITNNTLEFKGAGGNLYTNTAGAGVLASGGTIDLTIAARSPGADEGNDGAGTIVIMTTPLPGVTCTNPASTFSTVALTGTSTGTVTPTFGTAASASWVVLIAVSGQTGVATFKLSDDGGLTYGAAQATGAALVDVDGTGLNLAFANGATNPSFNAGDSFAFTSSGTWYTTQGTDEEGDDSLRQRCKARWPGLSAIPTDDVYTAMCKAADATVVKVRPSVDSVTPAQVNIYIAGSSSTASGAVVIAVQTYVDARRPLTDVPVVIAATQQTLTLSGATIRVQAAFLASAQERAQANLQTYCGGLAIGDGSTKKVRLSQIIEAILRESGGEDDSVNGMLLDGAAADLGITANHVIVWSQTIATAATWTTY